MSKNFTQTSDEPYLRHYYKLVSVDGKSIIFDNYQDAQLTWWNTPSDVLSHIEVIDSPPEKSSKKGFK